MFITCPNCSTKYNLPDSMFKSGAKARCTVCKHMFGLERPEDEVDAGVDALVSAKSGKQEGDSANVRGGHGADESLEDIIGAADGFNLDAPAKKSAKKRGKAVWVLLVLVLFAGAAAGVYVYMPQLLSMSETALEPSPNATAGEVAATDSIKHLALRNIRQYYQPNEKVGQLFVIEGKVVNNFKVAKELIKVEATLFDANNVTLTSKQQYCGVSVSLFQLQVLGQQELESALNNKIEILTNNTNVAPGQEVPFMVVFYNPPATVAEFGVKVIEAQDPPQK